MAKTSCPSIQPFAVAIAGAEAPAPSAYDLRRTYRGVLSNAVPSNPSSRGYYLTGTGPDGKPVRLFLDVRETELVYRPKTLFNGAVLPNWDELANPRFDAQVGTLRYALDNSIPVTIKAALSAHGFPQISIGRTAEIRLDC
jgi:hypothetical protein